MSKFEYINGSKELIDLVQPLWEKLNKHHEIKSIYFSDKYKNSNFENRKSKFINDESLNVKIDLIRDREKDSYIGYCISTLNVELVGEIDSLFIEEEYRKYGFGDELMKSAIEWLEENKAKTKIISVAEGNENVLEFYKRHGFYKRRVILEQVE